LWPAGVDFTNILQAAFAHKDPKSTKSTVDLTVFLKLLGSAIVKVAHKMLAKLTPSEIKKIFLL